MTRIPGMRLLPWPGADGRPLYLSDTPAEGARIVGRIADSVEVLRLGVGRALLEQSPERLNAAAGDAERLRLFAVRLVRSLAEVITVAVCRGERVTAAAADPDERQRLHMARVLLGHALHLLMDPKVPCPQADFMVGRLIESLADALRVADRLGEQLRAGGDGDGGRHGGTGGAG
ncbi:hypothetical protein RKE29_00115 [Streptomyces sp. B1866]|uniref:hypothetical protein n=1 Tax=Streptomyces sp. B1866 TaxID=3075431 RepID=UPI00288C6F2D|nr:hypothetical protein [Streptomyces sp. B1866]MDT3395078.1 hypothetical protein [Streptomyces sp. B1866]